MRRLVIGDDLCRDVDDGGVDVVITARSYTCLVQATLMDCTVTHLVSHFHSNY